MYSLLEKYWYPGQVKKKNCTSQSTIEVEYVVVEVNYSKIVWFKQLLEGMKVEIKEPVVMFL